jgi:tripartite-type tricarboxylate transporter receptor subunit TctC
MHPSSRRVLLSAAITVPWLMASRGARSQEAFPARPVRLVVPYPPGASTDSMARALARELSRELKVSVVVENRPGGGTTLGALAVRNAPADGYTLLFQVDGLYAGKLSSPSVAYEFGDFDIISPLAQTPFVLVVSRPRPSSRWMT